MTETSRESSTDESSGEIALAVPSWILLLLLALIPPVFANGFSNFEAIKEILLVGGAGAALLVWGILAIRARAASMVAGRVTVLALVFGAYSLGASLWADIPLLGLWESLHFAALAVVMLIVTAPIGRPLRFFDFAIACGVGAGLAGAMGLLDLAGLGVFTVVWDPPGATGAFDGMEFATAYYVVVLPLLLAAIFRFTKKWAIFFAVCFALAGFHFALMAGWWMAGAFAAVCAVSSLIFVGFQRALAQRVLIPVMILLGVVAVFLAVGQWGLAPPAPTSDATSLPYLQRTAESARANSSAGGVRDPVFAPYRVETVNSTSAHSYLFEVSTDLFAERPIVGHGAGSWWPLQTSAVNIDHPYVAGLFDHYPAFRTPHNGVSKILVEYGAVGLALFALWLAAVFSVAISALAGRTEHEEWIREHWALLTASLAGLVFLFFTPLVELAPAALVWVASLAMLLRMSATLNGFRGWSGRWSAGTTKEGGALGTVSASAAVAIVVAAAMVAVSVLVFMAEFHRGRADHMMLRTAYTRALSSYEKAHAWYPAFGEIPLNISVIASRTGQFDEYESFVDRAVEMRPYDTRALTVRGRMQLGMANRAPAVDYGQRAVEAFPNSLKARQLLIAGLDLEAKYQEAVDEAVELLERQPPPSYRAKLHMIAGDLYFDMLRQVAQAKRHYEQAIKYIEAPQQRIRIKEKVQKLEEVIEDKRRMREGKPPIHMQPEEGGHDGHGH